MLGRSLNVANRLAERRAIKSFQNLENILASGGRTEPSHHLRNAGRISPNFPRTILPERAPISDVPPNHLDRSVPGLVHDGPVDTENSVRSSAKTPFGGFQRNVTLLHLDRPVKPALVFLLECR
jgi:hypothetical protein